MLDKLKPVKITDAFGATHTGICQIMYYINQMILPYDKSLMETIKKEHIEDPEDILLIKINNTALYSITREKLYYNINTNLEKVFENIYDWHIRFKPFHNIQLPISTINSLNLSD